MDKIIIKCYSINPITFIFMQGFIYFKSTFTLNSIIIIFSIFGLFNKRFRKIFNHL